jgi:F-type H+-transporting ATPase subunit d
MANRNITKLDFSRVLRTLSPESAASIQSFRKRYDDLARQHYVLTQQSAQASQQLDLARYRNVLKNKAIVDKAEKAWSAYQPQKLDVKSKLELIGKFEKKAVSYLFMFLVYSSEAYCPLLLWETLVVGVPG